MKMGCSFFGSGSCFTNAEARAPNPSPARWKLLRKMQFDNAHVVEVEYADCTNYEGRKIMVIPGAWEDPKILDPHFEDTEYSPIARFRPTTEGWRLAVTFASNYGIR